MEKEITPISWRIYGLGIIAVGLVSLVFRDFHPGQPVPKSFPNRAILAYAANGFLIIAGICMEWRRFTSLSAAALIAYFGVLVVLLMDGNVIVSHPTAFVSYEGTAIELAIFAAALIIYAACADMSHDKGAQLTRIGQMIFGACAIVFGTAHFVYLKYTAALVPHWIPPSQVFWAIFCGVALVAAGIAILVGLYARLAAILITIMFAAFTPLVHLPLLLSDPHKYFYWTENTINLLLTGSAWVLADSLAAHSMSSFTIARRRRPNVIKT